MFLTNNCIQLVFVPARSHRNYLGENKKLLLIQLLIVFNVFCTIRWFFCLFLYALVNPFALSIDTIWDFGTCALIIARKSPGQNAHKSRATLGNTQDLFRYFV